MKRDNRGQLVLLAAAAIAVALVPLSLAYLGLSYHADVETAAADTDHTADAERLLGEAVRNGSRGVAGAYTWGDREAAVDDLTARLDPEVGRIERTRLDSGVAYTVQRNDSAAADWARTDCPRGPMRGFGRCESIDGVVVQERAGITTVLGVALDVRIVRARGETELTLLLPVFGG